MRNLCPHSSVAVTKCYDEGGKPERTLGKAEKTGKKFWPKVVKVENMTEVQQQQDPGSYSDEYYTESEVEEKAQAWKAK